MKKIIAALTLSTASMTSFAADTGPGCGVGTMIFEGKQGPVFHILAATTNGILGNQTFGMTSGTLGCNTETTLTVAGVYIDANMESLAMDIAKGEGETLATLSELLKLESADQAAFNATLKANFAKIFSADDITADQVLANIEAIMTEDEVLAAYVAA